ncbi:MAG: hypothetical protein Q8N23_29300 [Archangium sp.]|nr:hypothetical protein [Archangium sp.]MDP3156802.1 hypothetical protein [Archangium sp.]MDP3569650.1 hypothetical protein [Archangium sp.]
MSYSSNWLVVWRPEAKSASSRLTPTRAQLSATGQTLSIWATVTEPGAGCTPWLPNELAVGRIPKRNVVPSSIRVFVTSACGLITAGACDERSDCPQETPMCHGSFELPNGTLTTGVCAK